MNLEYCYNSDFAISINRIVLLQMLCLNCGAIGVRTPALPYWYLAYNEISQVLRSGDSEKVVQTTKKYQCEWVVSYQKLLDKNLIPRYEGEELFLYQVSK